MLSRTYCSLQRTTTALCNSHRALAAISSWGQQRGIAADANVPSGALTKFIIFGPPGVGKGTYSGLLSTLLDIPAIATGDLIRNEISKGTSLGNMVEKDVTAGKLLKDKIVLELLASHLEREDPPGFILDGIPRTVRQAELLPDITEVEAVIAMSLEDDLLLQKMIARRMCNKCGHNYNIAHIKTDNIDLPPLAPKVEGQCDHCKGELVQRKDDNVDTCQDRLATYHRETHPVLDYFTGKGKVLDFPITGTVSVMLPQLLQLVRHEGVTGVSDTHWRAGH